MKFITNYAHIKAPDIGSKCSYHQKIESLTTIHQNMVRQTVSRDISINFTSQTETGWEVACVIEKSKMELPSILRKQEMLSSKIAGVLSKMVLEIDQIGNIDKLLNYNEIISTWNELVPKLKKEYTGNGAEVYLKGINKKILNHDALLEDLKEYRMLGCLFSGLYQEHSDLETNREERKKISNLVMNIDVPVYETSTLVSNEEKGLTLGIGGSIKNDDVLEEKIKKALYKKNLYDNVPFLVDSYNGRCTVTKEDSFIREASLKIKTSYGKQYSKSIHFELTRN